MAGIYLHIPFCRKACHYCNFHFSTRLESINEMADALMVECMIRKDEVSEPIETIYFGGGTPSLLSAEKIEKILETICFHYDVTDNAEITLEANPDDITKEKANAWQKIGINRFSIGIQSFVEENLIWMNRAHNAEQSKACINIIRDAGFENFSIDLIYGTPGQSLQSWEDDVELAIKNKIPHLSCYALTVEEGTALHHMIEHGKRATVNTDDQAQCFQSLIQKISSAGYHHYEISNLALPGFESRHNSAYWEGRPYLGLGPSAHSFDGRKRSWNLAHNIDYMQAIKEGKLPSSSEDLSDIDLLNEYIMTSLRSSKGLNKNRIRDQWGEEKLNVIRKSMQIPAEAENVVESEDAWILTPKGRFLADGIAASLFFIST
jgi:oxygen-independent coproporphyrinogen-3 oxidase